MTVKRFVIEVEGYGDDISVSAVAAAIHSHGGCKVLSVGSFDPENYTYLGKIAAIRRVRALLGIGLRDSEFLVDYAENNGIDGTARWSDVTIIYNRDKLGYQVCKA